MTSIERRALLGDVEAQRECTENGIVLACPFCGGSDGKTLFKFVHSDLYAHKRTGRCALDGMIIHNVADWNRRPAPPIGRCASCACWDENTCECVAAADIEVAYHRYTEPDFFCGDYEPKGGEENG